MDRNICRAPRWLLAVGFGVASAMSIALAQAQQLCGGVDYPFPYTDVSGVGTAFCPGIMEAYVTGVSKGTSPTTFSPNATVTRMQMTTFLQRSLDQGLERVSRRAALKQWGTPQNATSMQTIHVGGNAAACATDGEFIWTSTFLGNNVVQVRASTGQVLGTWTGALSGVGIVVAAGKVFVTGVAVPGVLYVIDPTQPPGVVLTEAPPSLGGGLTGIAFDGTNLWTANQGGSVSIISPLTYATTTVTTGFNSPYGVLYDGANIWVTDRGAGTLLKLDSGGNILQTVAVGNGPQFPVFDGANIWVPNSADSSVTVVQTSSGNVAATILENASNLLSQPTEASFDGERILVANDGNDSVTVFKSADLSLIGNLTTSAGSSPKGACSDGINFWVTLFSTGNLLRF
jgi:hypothetical protein